MSTALDKIKQMKRGKHVVTNDHEMDEMQASGDSAMDYVRSTPNPRRTGLLDQYVAWIDPKDLKRASRLGIRRVDRVGPEVEDVTRGEVVGHEDHGTIVLLFIRTGIPGHRFQRVAFDPAGEGRIRVTTFGGSVWLGPVEP